VPGPDEFGPDGTQAPPPTRLYPDPLAGLLTGETYIAPKPVPVVVPRVVEPDPEIARAAIRAAAAHEQRSGPVRAHSPRQRQGPQRRAPVQQHRGSVQHQVVLPPQLQPFTPPGATEQPRKSGSSLGGCLVALVIFGALALTVFRQVLDALVSVFH
jgi:hypothetical protein